VMCSASRSFGGNEVAEVIGFIVNMAAVLFLAIEAFRQRERADRLQKLNMEILQNNDDLLGLTEQLTAAQRSQLPRVPTDRCLLVSGEFRK